MGHLLGASPRPTGSRANPVSPDSLLGRATWIEVDSLTLHPPDPAHVTAFAIDQPRPGDCSRGLGLEVNGWVIGRDRPIRGVRVSSAAHQSALFPLDVRRPDVAADYPNHPHAGTSGFSTWASIDPGERDWQIGVEAILANGELVRIAQIRGRVGQESHVPSPG